MIFVKKLINHMLFRMAMLIALSVGTALLLANKNWTWGISMLFLLFLSSWWLWKLYKQQIQKVIFLLDALENDDHAIRFTTQQVSSENKTINQLLNRVAQILRQAKEETVQQEKYYELILNVVNTGVVVLNKNGVVYQKNNEALRILGLEVFTHINQLDRISPVLKERLAAAQPGDKFQVEFSNKRGQINLSIRVSEIVINGEQLHILAFSDIHNELDAKEIDSWIRLIRVLTHEIMNSITPISSISETLLTHTQVKDPEIRSGLQTISTTGKGLLAFVESYRRFTRVPTPEPSLFYVKPFIDRMAELTRHQHPCTDISIQTTITPPDLILYADEQLISQVVINLLKNAVQAIGDQSGGLIEIHAGTNEHEEVWIEISNNGPQIPEDVAAQLFVPFFTTKEKGNGIGLSLSRQIMQVSGGTLTLLPANSSEKTIFSLCFK